MRTALCTVAHLRCFLSQVDVLLCAQNKSFVFIILTYTGAEFTRGN